MDHQHHSNHAVSEVIPDVSYMIEEDRYCVDILVQISAINAALKKVGYSITERHMKHCISHAVKDGEGEAAIDELLEVMKHYSK